MSTKKSKKEINYLEKDVFKLKTTLGEFDLEPYSFAIKIKIMKQGIMDKMLSYYKNINQSGINLKDIATQKDTMKQKDQDKLLQTMDFSKYGDLLESLIDAIWLMVPKNIELQGRDKLINSLIESEVYNFMNWLVEQIGKEQNFLAQGKEKAV